MDNTLSGLEDQHSQTKFNEMIKEIIAHDVVLIPFFADKANDDKQTVLVSLTPSKWKTDLFWSESRNT